MDKTEYTLDYYNQRALEFVQGTLEVDFSNLQNQFMDLLPAGGRILDLGCGSGRDSKAFIDRGFQVIAVDGSEALCQMAEAYIGQKVICSRFQDLQVEESLDGIWACASLLHLNRQEVVEVLNKLTKNLKKGGIVYASFKYGDFEGERRGRFFMDMTEDSFGEILEEVEGLKILKQMITRDVRPDREEVWLNLFLEIE
ncbi:MAG: class I SAM-dependent methyltransferase [Eubacterium sp.]|nr:class I SAM-dependent methyltransferase [Eubacterium sp.]